jgi:ABC-2 type transport system permease protein
VPAGPAPTFPWLLLPGIWATRNRMRKRQAGDTLRGLLFGGIGLGVGASIFAIVFWLTWQLLDYAELGDYLVRLGFSWLFLTFLSFLAFSAVVTALSTFFLSDDLRLVLAAPVSVDRMFYSRYVRTVAQSAWMVVAFIMPVLLAVGFARCAPLGYYVTGLLTVSAFVLIPVSFGCVVTLLLVNVFPARRARDILMLMGLLFAVAIVVMLRFLRPERLLNVTSLPDITGFFATLQSPVTPLLPSFWAGETIFGALMGTVDTLHAGALASSAAASVILARLAFGRFYFDGWSKAQEARKARFTRLRWFDALAERLPVPLATRTLLVKDAKIFLRDTAQWSQLLLLVALMLVYLYNFKVLDLDRIPYMSRVVKNVYAFVNMAMAAFVLSAVAVRFVFPSISAEGSAFWIIRTSAVDMRRFLWSKFWIGLVPVMILAEALTIISNELLGAAPFLKVVSAIAIFFMTLALVGLAAGMGAMYPRFSHENLTQVSGSYGGISFMIAAVLFILVEIALVAWPSTVYLWYEYRGLRIPDLYRLGMAASFLAAAGLAVTVWRQSMKRGIAALEALG